LEGYWLGRERTKRAPGAPRYVFDSVADLTLEEPGAWCCLMCTTGLLERAEDGG